MNAAYLAAATTAKLIALRAECHAYLDRADLDTAEYREMRLAIQGELVRRWEAVDPGDR